MKLFAGVLIVALLIEGNLAFWNSQTVVPDALLNLSGPLSGQYQTFIGDLNNLIATNNAFIGLNVSPNLNATAGASNTILNQIIQLSGPSFGAAISYSSSLPAIFSSLIQAFSNYSNSLGLQVINILNQEIFGIQIALNNLIQNAIVDVTTVNSNVINVLNSIGFLLLTADVIDILLSDNLTDAYADFMLSFAIIIETVYAIVNNVLFLVVLEVSDPIALNNINIIILNSIPRLQLASKLQSNTSSNANSSGSFASNIAGLLPLLLQQSFSFMNSVRAVPNLFSYLYLTYLDPFHNLQQVANALNQLTVQIGVYTGPQIYNIITTEFSSAYSDIIHSNQ